MFSKVSAHTKAILLALLVTVLWSSSWVLIKIGLHDIPPLTFAGLRYVLAFLVLLPVTIMSPSRRKEIQMLNGKAWLHLAFYGLINYTATQGLSFVALANLQAATLSLLLSFTSVIVAFMAFFVLAEAPSALQGMGILFYLVGAAVYFFPFEQEEPVFGLMIGGVVLLANAATALLGRDINRARTLSPVTITFISMGIGSIALLMLGISMQGLPHLNAQTWMMIAWLAIINSALAFTLWNTAQRTLTATESSIINNTMLIQTAIFAWIFLGEILTLLEIAGLSLAALGILLVQLRAKPHISILRKKRDNESSEVRKLRVFFASRDRISRPDTGGFPDRWTDHG